MIELFGEQELKDELQVGETFLWTGRPQTGIIFRSSDIFFIPFSLIWGGFVMFVGTRMVLSDAPFFAILWNIPFVLVGAYVTVGRFFIDAKKRKNTIYGITANRVIIKTGIFSQSVSSLNIRTLPTIELKPAKGNVGTVVLGLADVRYSMMQGMNWPGVKQPPMLELIDNARQVYQLLVGLQNQQLGS